MADKFVAIVSGEEILTEGNPSPETIKLIMVVLLDELSLTDKRDVVERCLLRLEKSELFHINSGFKPV
jgi:hypothetical protein